MTKVVLLYRNSKYVDESFFDYLSRLSYWNGFGSVEKFSKFIAEAHGEKLGGVRDQRKNEYMLRCWVEQLLRRNIPISQMNSLMKSKISHGKARVCPHCWEESRYIRFYWRFDDYIVCHKHQTLLVPFLNWDMGICNHNDCVSEEFAKESSEAKSILMQAIKIHAEKDNALTLIEKELDRHGYEKSLVFWISAFFKNNLHACLNEDEAKHLIDSNALVGNEIFKRMDLIIQELLGENAQLERRLRILLAVHILDNKSSRWRRIYRDPADGYKEWASAEVLSIDELLYAYIGFGTRQGCPKNFKFRYEIRGFENLDESEDRRLCVAIFGAYIKWPYEKTDDDLRDYQNRIINQKPSPGSIKYGDYLRSLGKMVLDDIPPGESEQENFSFEVEECAIS